MTRSHVEPIPSASDPATHYAVGPDGSRRQARADKKALAVLPGRIVLVHTATRAATDVYGEPGRFIGSLAVAPGGRRVYFTSAVTRSNIWMMRLPPR